MITTLSAVVEADPAGADLLLAQAHTLDSVFHRLAAQGFTVKGLSGKAIPGRIDETALALALRSQKQCRMALLARAWMAGEN